jgi:hypothetical protein
VHVVVDKGRPTMALDALGLAVEQRFAAQRRKGNIVANRPRIVSIFLWPAGNVRANATALVALTIQATRERSRSS